MRLSVLMWMVLVDPILSLAAGQVAAASDVECLEELELPQFAVVNRVPVGGEVRAVVKVGKDGEAASVHTESTDPSLSTEVEHHLRKRAVYKTNCSGREVRFWFTFKVEGEPAPSPCPRFRFRPPNHFVITVQPLKPTVDYFPLDPKKSKQAPGRR